MASINAGESQRFAVYAGDGQYVTEHANRNATGPGNAAFPDYAEFAEFIRLGDAQAALALPRRQAIDVCHGARRTGVMAWLVPHPVGVAA